MLQISLTTYGLIYQVSSGSDKSAGGQVTLQGSCLSCGRSVIQTTSVLWLYCVNMRPLQRAWNSHLSLQCFGQEVAHVTSHSHVIKTHSS